MMTYTEKVGLRRPKPSDGLVHVVRASNHVWAHGVGVNGTAADLWDPFNRLLWIVTQADEQLGMNMTVNTKQKLTLAIAGGFKAHHMHVAWDSELEEQLGDQA